MKRLALFLLMFSTYSIINAQSLKGTVAEEGSGESIPMANVVIKSGKTIIQGGATDFDGNYIISPITPGIYSVEVSFIGFETKKISNIEIKPSKESILNVTLGDDPEPIIIIHTGCTLNPPFLLYSSGTTYSSEDIAKMPILR